ncbi:MAG: glycosyltransferase family 9 protein [Lentisphaerae bacterium]|nr:glycosyltransferase family 9 protein [Lentisphaerota bacterium]
MALISSATLKRLDATAGYLLCKLIGRARHYTGRPELAPDPAPESVRRVLIIRPGGMGDLLMLLPVIRSLRSARPDLEIDIICERRNADVLKLAGLEGRAILYDATPHRIFSLGSTRYDVVLDTEQFHNFSAIMAWMSGAPVRVGFRINPARLSLYTHLVSYDIDGYELDQFARLLRPLGVPLSHPHLDGVLADVTPPLDAQVPSSVSALRRAGPLVALSPGSSDPYKQWGPEKFRHLIRELLERGCGIVLVGGQAELAQAQSLAYGLPADRIINAVSTMTLMQTAAILQASTLFIGGDSGLGHLAVALARPTLILFGPSDRHKWSRPTERHRVIRRDLPCAPCSIFGYHKLCRKIPCMTGIAVADVVQAAEALLTAAPRTGPSAKTESSSQ